MNRDQLKKLVEYPIVFIEEDSNGIKQCHFSLCGTRINQDDPPEMIEYVGFIIPMTELLDKHPLMWFDIHESTQKQYIETFKDIDELVDAYATANNGLTPEPLSIEQISQNTPNGCYILVDEKTLFELGLIRVKFVLVSASGTSIDHTYYDTFYDAQYAMKEAYHLSREYAHGVDYLNSSCDETSAVLFTEDENIIWNILEIRF